MIKYTNTDTATELGSYWNGVSRSDFTFCREELYRKKTGEYFLYGEGGPMSKYAHHISYNEVCGDEDITPFDEDQARYWAERHLDADEYIAIFGEPEE